MKGAIRAVLGVVIGYAVYVVGLMQLVLYWFVRGSGLSGFGPQVLNGVALVALGWIAGWVAKWVSGGRAGALVGLAVIVTAIGIVNLALGIATEPPWYTVLVVVIVVSMLLFHRARLVRATDSR